jgi:hypothetical protein
MCKGQPPSSCVEACLAAQCGPAGHAVDWGGRKEKGSQNAYLGVATVQISLNLCNDNVHVPKIKNKNKKFK